MAKKDTRSLAEIFGGQLPSPDIILARKETAKSAIAARNIRATETGAAVRKAVEYVQKGETERKIQTLPPWVRAGVRAKGPSISKEEAAKKLIAYARDKGKLSAELQKKAKGFAPTLRQKAAAKEFVKKYPWGVGRRQW